MQEVKQSVLTQGLVSSGETVVVAVSGGPDSVALLYMMHALRHELGIHLHVAHLNHQLRRQARRDELFVRRLAQELRCPCHVAKADPAKLRQKASLEEAAREARLKFLMTTAQKHRAKKIALAHTQDDQAETILMRILRGTGLQGIRGMVAQRKMGGFIFIRPFLGISKSRIIQFLKLRRIPFCVDETNAQTEFFRNRIRLKILPFLEREAGKDIKISLANLADTAGADYDFIEGEGRRWFLKLNKKKPAGLRAREVQLDLARLNRLPPALRRMVLRIGFKNLVGHTRRLSLRHLRIGEKFLADKAASGEQHLPLIKMIKKNDRTLILRRF